ncbi:MAG: 7-cyano-7-deazaguanine synthase [Desulfomonile tiedjei]|nr:7-cyano-7-deazaguanine synthase [Desulfomonile tiedjei]
MARNILILMGGGIDSTALLHYFLLRDYAVRGLHYDYGQPTAAAEQRAVKAVAAYYGIEVGLQNLPVPVRRVEYEFACRNALLVLAAAAAHGHQYTSIGLGIHTGTPYFDCSRVFIQHLQSLLDGYFQGVLQLQAPFVDLTKTEILSFCHAEKIPLEMTFSCEIGPKHPCGVCPSCKDRLANGLNH